MRPVALRRPLATLATMALAVGLVSAGATAPAAAAEVGFSVDDFAGNSMGIREVLPQPSMSCDITGNTQATQSSGSLRVDIKVPDRLGCNYGVAGIRWTASQLVDIEQGGADRIQLKYRDVTPDQPSAITFGLTVVDTNGKAGRVGGLTRNGGAAGDWLTIRYEPAYVGDVSYLTFEPGFDRGRVASITLHIAATASHQNVGVTFEGIGANVGEPIYRAPSFSGDSTLVFPANTMTTRTVTVSGNPAPDVSVTSGLPSWMSASTASAGETTTVTLSGNPGSAYSDTTLQLHADVANSLTADHDLRIVVPSPVTVGAWGPGHAHLHTAGPITIGSVGSTPVATVVGPTTGLPPGTSLDVSVHSIRLTGTPTVTGVYTVATTIGNGFTSAPFERTITVGEVPSSTGIGPLNLVRNERMTPVMIPASGYPVPTFTPTAPLPAGLSLTSRGELAGTPSTRGTSTLTVSMTNAFGVETTSVVVNVGDRPTVTAPAVSSVRAGTAADIAVPVTGELTSVSATGLPSGLSMSESDGIVRITGTPTVPSSAAAASGTATLTVANDFGSASATWQWTLEAAAQISGPASVSTSVGSALTGAMLDVIGFPTPGVRISASSTLPAGLWFDRSSPGQFGVSGTPTAAGSVTLTLTADNGVGDPAVHTLTIHVLSAPSFASDAPILTLHAGDTATLTLNWGGNDRPVLALESPLPPWLSFDAPTGTFTATAPATAPGTHGPYIVTATNSSGTATARVGVTVLAAPTVTAAASVITLTRGQAYTDLQPLASHTGYPRGSVDVVGLPSGVTATTSGSDVSYSGLSMAPAGDYPVTVTVTNEYGTASADLTVVIATPATLSAPSTHSIAAGAATTLPVEVGGHPRPALVASGLPAGLTLDASEGTITGTPTRAGVYSIVLSTTGGHGPAPTPTTMTLVVTSVPAFVSPPTTTTIRLGDAADVAAFTVTGTPGPTASATGLPAGMTLSQTAGSVRLVGTPTEEGEFTADVTLASDGGTTSTTWTIVVERPSGVTVAASTTLAKGAAVTPIPVVLSGHPAPTVSASGLPAGLALVSDSNGIRIVGTPTVDGTHRATLTATNGVGPASTATITFDVQSAPSLGADATVAFPADETSTLVIASTGYPAPTLTTSALPAWLAFDAATGTFTATPGIADAGLAADVIVTATNAVASDTSTVRLSVTTPPDVDVSSDTTRLRSWQVVDIALAHVTGFPAPTATSSGLPAGLRIDIVDGLLRLVGMTTGLGSHDIVIELENGTVTRSIGWTILVERAEPVVEISDASVMPGASIDVAASGLQPGDDIEVWMHSTPVKLAAAQADRNGNVSLTVRIPADATPGAHRIVVVTPSGSTASVPITVTPALASTGIDATGALVIALLALAAGLLLAFRRRIA